MKSRWYQLFPTHCGRNLLLSFLLLSLQYLEASSSLEQNDMEMKFDFVPLYRDLVAQAMAYAKCWENESLPTLDEDSLIMKPAHCKANSENCTSCIKRVQGMMSNDSNGESLGPPVNFFQDFEPPKPVFHCTKHVGAKKESEMFFRMDYTTPLPASDISHSDLLPRVFVVEKEVDGKWIASGLQYYWLFALETKNQSTYRVRVTAVSPRHVYYPQLSKPIKLYNPTVHKTPPKHLRVTSITVNRQQPRPSPIVMLRWESSSGGNASCDYDVHYMSDDSFKTERKRPNDAFWVRLDTFGPHTSLEFNQNYDIELMERFVGGESHPAKITVSIPSCLKMLNHSFQLCPPPSPRNIRVQNDTGNSFWITWDPPVNQSYENHILFYDLNVDRYPLVHSEISLYKQKPIFKGSVNGSLTSVEIQAPSIKSQIRISIIARTQGGPSHEALFIYSLRDLSFNKTVRNVMIGVFVVVALFVIIPGGFLVKWYYDKCERNKKLIETFDQLEKDPLPTQQVDRYSSKLEIEFGCLVFGEVIDETVYVGGLDEEFSESLLWELTNRKGQFGLVRKAVLHDQHCKRTVAVKTMKDGSETKDSAKFWEEFKILEKLEPHTHVVGLVGIVKNHRALVVEYCDGGDLYTHLKKVAQSLAYQSRNDRRTRYSPSSSAMDSSVHLISNEVRVQTCSLSMVTNEAYFIKNDGPLTSLDLLSYARQIAYGMEHLSNNKIVHRDLAARNILISGPSRTLKIADFGLSKDVYFENFYKKTSDQKIPIKWLAVECLLKQMYTTKSDVWSYGIVLWEIVTLGGSPYPGVENIEIFEMLQKGYRMSKPKNCSDELYDLMMLCWDDDANYRPDFSSIRCKLEEMIENSNYVSYLNLVSGSTDTCNLDSRNLSLNSST